VLFKSPVSNQKGYSLVELVLVMGVLASLLFLTVNSLRGSQEREDLELTRLVLLLSIMQVLMEKADTEQCNTAMI
jgi:prepilin-type N-terminal cleavage/methylation domain-containing protein